jgi:hypothetical protein
VDLAPRDGSTSGQNIGSSFLFLHLILRQQINEQPHSVTLVIYFATPEGRVCQRTLRIRLMAGECIQSTGLDLGLKTERSIGVAAKFVGAKA